MEGLKSGSYVFNFGGCRAKMAVFYDDRDGQVFVTDECLDALKTLVGPQKARAVSTAAVVIDGQHLNAVNGARMLTKADVQEAFDKAKSAGTVISITRSLQPLATVPR